NLQQGEDLCFDLIPNLPEEIQGSADRVGDGPIQALPRGEPWAGISAAHSHHNVEILPGEILDGFGELPGDVDSLFRHHLDGQGGDEAGGVGSGTVGLNLLSSIMPGETFGHLTAAGIADTDKEQ